MEGSQEDGVIHIRRRGARNLPRSNPAGGFKILTTEGEDVVMPTMTRLGGQAAVDTLFSGGHEAVNSSIKTALGRADCLIGRDTDGLVDTPVHCTEVCPPGSSFCDAGQTHTGKGLLCRS